MPTLFPRRFIPACTGNSAASLCGVGRAPVHPRVYGELGRSGRLESVQDGSSPRVRGTPGDRGGRGVYRWFIPACTGNSVAFRKPPPPATVHPRVYGELSRLIGSAWQASGSSPRVRGTPAGPSHHERRARFIPACTGNSGSSWRRTRRTAVHPRVYGELVGVRVAVVLIAGSSPRVRGTRRLLVQQLLPHRFIPACTGNSPTPEHKTDRHPVHPRVYGELSATARKIVLMIGSSPRVRGTPARLSALIEHRRFIPACTGNSAT